MPNPQSPIPNAKKQTYAPPAYPRPWPDFKAKGKAEGAGRYAPPEMIGTERNGIFGIREEEERTICTSHVERHNLTIRTLMKRFTRLSLGFSKKLGNLEAACAVFLAFYNFCWRTRDVVEGGSRLPAAVAAGVTDTLMSFEQLFDTAMGGGYAMAA